MLRICNWHFRTTSNLLATVGADRAFLPIGPADDGLVCQQGHHAAALFPVLIALLCCIVKQSCSLESETGGTY
jgi:hypothetical protein